jgi:fluoroquinolone resistance protein
MSPPPPRPATDTEIRRQDWEGQQLAGERHERVAFVEADLTDAVNRGGFFSECVFRDCRFGSSAHTDAAFLNCTFTNCNLFDASFKDCKMVGSAFDRCRFELLRVDGGDWSFVALPRADLGRVSFVDVRMREADLRGARCAGARFRRVDLGAAILQDIDFNGADVRGSDLSALDPTAADLYHTIIDPDQAVTLAMALGLDVRPLDDL